MDLIYFLLFWSDVLSGSVKKVGYAIFISVICSLQSHTVTLQMALNNMKMTSDLFVIISNVDQ